MQQMMLMMQQQMQMQNQQQQQQLMFAQNSRIAEERAREREQQERERAREWEQQDREQARALEFERLKLLTAAAEQAQKNSPKKDDSDEEEAIVKTGSLKKLDGVQFKNPAIRAGNWLVRATSTIAGMSNGAEGWFKEVQSVAETAYQHFQRATPIDRLSIQPTVLENSKRFTRLRAKVSELLLDALDQEMQDELIGTRKQHPVQIILHVLKRYGPGSSAERQQL
jgi:hypothetical protein